MNLLDVLNDPLYLFIVLFLIHYLELLLLPFYSKVVVLNYALFKL